MSTTEQMIQLASEFSKQLKSGDCVHLVGEMGVGKTIFAKGICEGLGCTEVVNSPTYSIMQEYNASLTIFHYDFYRIIEQDEALELGLTEFFQREGSVCLIEWGCNIPSYLPNNMIEIIIRKIDYNTREVCINA